MTEHHIHVNRTARYHLLGDTTKARAIWVVLHGYGQLARYFLNKFEGLSHDLLIAAPEGLNRYYIDTEHSRVGATWMTREDREHEIKDQVAYLDQLVDALRRDHGPLPVSVLGFSQGVATASRWIFHGRTRPVRLVLWAGGIPPEADLETLHRCWSDLALDVVLGKRDEFADDVALAATTDRLRQAKVAYRLHRFEGGHTLEPVLLKRLING